MKKKTMLTYIEATSQMMSENIKRSHELTKSLVQEYIQHNYENIWIIASGSSYNGSACARLFMQKVLGCQVKLITPFQFVHAEHDVPAKDMILIISQSGYSKNSILASDTVKTLRRRVLVLTGDTESDISANADLLIDFGVGTETVAYVTKGVNALALYLMLFALETATQKKNKTPEEISRIRDELEKLPAAHRQLRKQFPTFFENHLELFTSMQNAYVCSCGANLGTAMEGALKIGETIQIPSAAYEVEEYIHGPNLQLTPNYTVFFVDGGCASRRTYEIFESTKLVTKKTILVTNNATYSSDNLFCVPLLCMEELTPLCFLAFFQMMSYEVTERLHLWEKHPLQLLMKEKVAAKTKNYAKSPLKLHMPG